MLNQAVKLQGGQKGTDLPIFKHQCNSKYGIPGSRFKTGPKTGFLRCILKEWFFFIIRVQGFQINLRHVKFFCKEDIKYTGVS